MKRSLVTLACLFVPLIVCGCGGGGSVGGGGSRSIGVFLSDSFRDDYDHVWATIHRVELVDSTGGTQILFDDSRGQVVDLRTLHDSTGARFEFLALASVSSGVTLKVRATIGSSLGLVAKGASDTQIAQLTDDTPRDGQGHARIEFVPANPIAQNGSDDLVVDFDLANFALVNGKVRPSLKQGDKNGLNSPGRHEHGERSGVVSALSGTAPNFTFTLSRGSGTGFTVATDANTAIFNAGSAANAVLSNGQHVEVRGKFDPATRVLHAVEIKIEGASEIDDQGVRGAPSNINATAGTFTITAGHVKGFVPTSTAINIATNSSTVFRTDGGLKLTATEFFTALATSTGAEAEGTYDAGSNTLLATRVKLENGAEGNDDHEAEARGQVYNPDKTSSAFSIKPLVEWSGFTPDGDSVKVQTNTLTRFRDRSGAEMTAQQWYDYVTLNATASTAVRARGTYANGVITAREARLE